MGEGCVCYLSKALSSVILIEIFLIKTVSTGKIEAMLSRAVPWLVGAQARHSGPPQPADGQPGTARPNDLLRERTRVEQCFAPQNPRAAALPCSH